MTRQFAGAARPRWWQQKIAVGGAVFGLILGAPAAAFAISGSPLPDPVRSALHDVGLPVDSVDVADARSAESHLEKALRSGDTAAVSRAAAHLQECLAELDRGDRNRMAPRADALLQDATSNTGSSPGGPIVSRGDGSSNSGSGDRSTVPSLPATTTTTTATHDGGTQGGDGDQSTTTTTTPSASGSPGDQTTTTTVAHDGDGGGGSGGDGATTTTTTKSSD